jgi:hypothetical protein
VQLWSGSIYVQQTCTSESCLRSLGCRAARVQREWHAAERLAPGPPQKEGVSRLQVGLLCTALRSLGLLRVRDCGEPGARTKRMPHCQTARLTAHIGSYDVHSLQTCFSDIECCRRSVTRTHMGSLAHNEYHVFPTSSSSHQPSRKPIRMIESQTALNGDDTGAQQHRLPTSGGSPVGSWAADDSTSSRSTLPDVLSVYARQINPIGLPVSCRGPATQCCSVSP